MEDKKYPIELEVITPLAVGNGNDKEWIKGLDFVQKDNKVYILDLHKAVELGVDVGRLTNLFLKYDEKGILQFLGNNVDKVAKYVFESPMRTDNKIKAFIRTQLFDKPIVAGSSLKGAIRSALFNFLRTTEESNGEVFGTMKEGTDFMRFIRVGDIEMPSTILVNSKIYNLRGHGTQWQGGWKHAKTNKEGDSFTTGDYSPQGFNTLYECVAPGQKGMGNISMAGNAYDLLEHYGHNAISYSERKHNLIHAPISELFKIINNVTKAYLTKEKHFFEQYPAQRTDEIVSHIEYLINMIPTDGSSCLLKMSAGVGFHSITGDWQFDDYDIAGLWKEGKNKGKKKYKSRKIADYDRQLQLMGFVKLRLMNKEEAVVKATELQEQHDAIVESILAPIIERETAKLKSAEVERQRIEAQEAEKQRIAKYQQLLGEARELYDKNLWDEAIEKAKEAADIGPDYKDHQPFIELCEKSKDIAQYEKEQEEITINKFKLPLAEVLKGKTSVGNIVGTTAKWIKLGNSFNEQECQVLISCLKEMPIKEIKKKRKDFEKAINKEWTDKVWHELNIT